MNEINVKVECREYKLRGILLLHLKFCIYDFTFFSAGLSQPVQGFDQLLILINAPGSQEQEY